MLYGLFQDSKTLINANTLTLSATTLTNYCYQSMFSSCINLTQVATILPATTLAPKCYYNMFNSCKSLQIGAELPSLYLEKRGTSGIPSNWTVIRTN